MKEDVLVVRDVLDIEGELHCCRAELPSVSQADIGAEVRILSFGEGAIFEEDGLTCLSRCLHCRNQHGRLRALLAATATGYHYVCRLHGISRILDKINKDQWKHGKHATNLAAECRLRDMTSDERIAAMTFAAVYPCYVAKVTRKGRTQQELDDLLCWFMQIDRRYLHHIIDQQWTLETVFSNVTLHAHASLITGTICGHRVENITNPLTQRVRYMDKIVDELAKGRSLTKIQRQPLS